MPAACQAKRRRNGRLGGGFGRSWLQDAQNTVQASLSEASVPACRSAIDFVYATGGPEPAGGQGCRGAARCLESKSRFPGLTRHGLLIENGAVGLFVCRLAAGQVDGLGWRDQPGCGEEPAWHEGG